MTHNLKKTFAVLLLAIFGSTILYNCEPDVDSLGEQLFIKDQVDGNETLYDLIAYNIDNHDSIRSDASKLISEQNAAGGFTTVGVLGAFTENQFGGQKASYITQLRMPTDNFDFTGPNAKVDSVVLVMKTPYYITDSVKAPGAYDRSDFPVGNETVPVSIDKKTYPVFKYGKIGGQYNSMTINVHEVTTFLDANAKPFTRSNVDVSTGGLLGSAVFDGRVSTIAVTKKSDNTAVFNSTNDFRMRLDKDFFQTRIVDKKGMPELQNTANFIRYLRGIKISVSETDKYLFQFSPNDMEIVMYYKYDKTDNGTTTRPQTTLKFNLGGGNVHIGQYAYNRTGSQVSSALAASNDTTGDPKLYAQGMGGPSIGVKIPEEAINKLKSLYEKDKAGIVSAKIRIYVDPLTWSNKHSKFGDSRFSLLPVNKDKGKDGEFVSPGFTSDLMAGFPLYLINEKPAYYDFVITKTIKGIVEGPADGIKITTDNEYQFKNNVLLINQGAFARIVSSGAYFGPTFTTRAFDMNRTILVGSDKSANRIQLRVTYGTKK
ncbi:MULTISPECIES: DUF4270 family protein [Chryseobacterium]|uniref:DUF4270 domain-containing protein n=1 Tax=Chryseobacterium rhizosphaerae TaxID=395937 RepID=A0AAE3YCY8_9FLAO|nr:MULTISPECIES: DUF4270 family protein [Chryseobacterium]MBL3548412.1 DUF4270 family protein [Chryseobacterium sp. KMC2]MDR6528150.1 hypothetical protein [Chryseobacterium rhizosphaerae]